MAGGAAALLWVLWCLRWFDAAALFRPAWLAWLNPYPLIGSAVLLALLWLTARRRQLGGRSPEGPRGALLLILGLTVLFRLPLAWQGAAGYVTADGALSGIVAQHLREGGERRVFVPHVPYSGSLKSHLTAPLSALMDTARAFALCSVFFYALFVAGLCHMALLLREGGAWTAVAAGLYAAFPPAFVTRYSLSNDGNYVEVLALGTWALVLAVRWARQPADRPVLALGAGLLLGLAFWCHILAVIHAAAVAVFMVLADARRALRSALPLAGGFALGAAPSLLWNAANGWESFLYLLPGGQPVGAAGQGPGLAARAVTMATGQWPVLLGYDPGYAPALDTVLLAYGLTATACAAMAVAAAVGEARRPCPVLRLLLLFSAINLAVALLALPLIPGNPRYLLFLMAPLPILLARAFRVGWRRAVLAVLVGLGALASWGQAPGAFRSDAQWRAFVGSLAAEGVRWCHTDFYLATKINFLSEEAVTCSAKLGPTSTEYFYEYRRRVERAPEAALVAVNPTAAEKLERRLERLGVTYERRDLMKPVLLRLSRKVDPQELFPARAFPWR